jgi:hypothetical protein
VPTVIDTEHDAATAVSEVSQGVRQHTLALSGGQAVLRLPATITVAEARMLGMLIATHCPEARFELPNPRPQREDALSQADS